MLRSLIHHWRPNLAVALGAAVACTVLTGALLAGDSVRGSLVALSLDRLGGVDVALVAESFVREELAAELEVARSRRAGSSPAPTPETARSGAGAGQAERPGLPALGPRAEVAPLIVARASAAHGGSAARAAGITVYGIDRRFARLHGDETVLPALAPPTGAIFPPVALNAALATDLGATAGDDVLLSFELPGTIPRETLLGEKDSDDALVTRRFAVSRVIPDRGLGGFALVPHQAQPRNAFVDLATLQEPLDRRGRVNALVGTWKAPAPAARLRLDDLGLRLVRGDGHLSLESEEFFLRPAVAIAAGALATEIGTRPRRVFTYLATELRSRERSLPYSMVAGLSPAARSAAMMEEPGPLAPRDGEVVLNEWAAADLGVTAESSGQPVELAYLRMAPGGGLVERRTTLRLAGIVATAGPGADRSLTPTFPGIATADDMAAWDPPFPVELDRIRPRDEEYWDAHGPAPKAFVSLATAQRLWRTRFGELTALRFEGSAAELDRVEQALRDQLPERIDPASFGLVFRPVKREALDAARGSTDFAGLFLGFSFFLMVSAVLLAGLLFSLAVNRRVKEMGALLAVGYRLRAVRRRLLGEGLMLAATGSFVGLAGACGWAALLMAGLRSWWLPAVGTPELYLHVEPASLGIGWAISVLTVLAAIAWTVRGLARLPVTSLLAGETRSAGVARDAPWLRRIALGAGAVTVALVLVTVASGRSSSPAFTFGAGAAALVAGLAALMLWLRRPPPARRLTLLAMAARNGAANPGRSLLAVTLVAAACFVLVAVAANRRDDAGSETGAGGFALYAESAVPLASDPGQPDGRAALGLDESALANTAIVSLRLVAGDDASCLNLYRPSRPRLLGVPRGTLAGRFAVHSALPPDSDPWQLLTRDLGPGVVPVIADESSATWILKRALGEDVVVTDEAGATLRLRLVGLLERSLFQSELLVDEQQLLRHFPTRAGRSFFLVDAPPTRLDEVSRTLEQGLDRHGLDVRPTAQRIAAYGAVEATYLQTFAALGGFGLLLGTAGLAIALLRGVLERRGELAALRAFGFQRRRLLWMVTAENGVLLVLGVALGTAAGLLAVAPRVIERGAAIPWTPLLATLSAVLLCGLLASLGAVWGALRARLLPALKEER